MTTVVFLHENFVLVPLACKIQKIDQSEIKFYSLHVDVSLKAGILKVYRTNTHHLIAQHVAGTYNSYV